MSGSIQASQPETVSAPRAPRFTLRYLFLLTAVVALALLPVKVWGEWGIVSTCLGGAIGVLLLHRKFTLAKDLIVVLLLVMLLTAILMPAAGPPARTPSRRSECKCKIRQLALALENYASNHGHYPPLYTVDDDGNPLHSWRVLILPYIEEQDLYNSIDLTKPWRHPENLALADKMPDLYRCPSSDTSSQGSDVTTSYLAISGDRTAWPRSGIRKPRDFEDGLSNTLLVVECEKHRLHWMSTGDPDMQMIGALDGNGTTILSHAAHGVGKHRGSHVTFGDGHTEFVRHDIDFRTLRAMLTIDGREEIDLPDR